MRDEVIQEARRNAGAVVVTHETDAGEIFHALECVMPAVDEGGTASVGAHGAEPVHSVHTPLELFDAVKVCAQPKCRHCRPYCRLSCETSIFIVTVESFVGRCCHGIAAAIFLPSCCG